MARIDVVELARVLRAHRSFLVVSHSNPDGDAIGSMLALFYFLKAIGKDTVWCVNKDPVPRVLQWLPGAEHIQRGEAFEAPLPVDAVVLVDAATKARLGDAARLIPAGATVIVVDHHLEDRPEGHYVFSDPAHCAVGETILALFEAAGVPLSREAAECAYVSIITDTGGFRFANTTPASHRAAARLIETGLDVAEIMSRVFERSSPEKLALLTRVLERMRREAQGRMAHSYLTLQDMRDTGARIEDLDGLVDFTRNTDGVMVGLLFRETEPAMTKVSMRSRPGFNCAEFLKLFDGGGHAGAAGANVALPVSDAQTLVLSRLRPLLGESS